MELAVVVAVFVTALEMAVVDVFVNSLELVVVVFVNALELVFVVLIVNVDGVRGVRGRWGWKEDGLDIYA